MESTLGLQTHRELARELFLNHLFHQGQVFAAAANDRLLGQIAAGNCTVKALGDRPNGIDIQGERGHLPFTMGTHQLATVADMDRLIGWLPDNMPKEDGSVSLIHGDCRMDNIMFHASEERAIALLDWELSTLGHPFADSAYQCMQWRFDYDDVLPGLGKVDRVSLGIPTDEQYLARHCERRGLAGIPDWNFYLAFSLFRMAAIVQGILKRAIDGNASSTVLWHPGWLPWRWK